MKLIRLTNQVASFSLWLLLSFFSFFFKYWPATKIANSFDVLKDASLKHFLKPKTWHNELKLWKLSTELLEESRHKCQQLESEVDRRQLEAQDGWAAAARLQQHFQNLQNILKDPKLGEQEGEDEDEDLDGGEPTELAGRISAKIVLLKNDYEDLVIINAKQNECNSQLFS